MEMWWKENELMGFHVLYATFGRITLADIYRLLILWEFGGLEFFGIGALSFQRILLLFCKSKEFFLDFKIQVFMIFIIYDNLP